MSTRLAKGGRLIDRTSACEFTFNGKRLKGYKGDTLAAALQSLPVRPSIETQPPKLGVPERVLPPREAMLAPFETLPREQALGRVLAAPTVSCPPAVPILVCGERIDAQALALFAYYGLDWLDVVLPDFEQGGTSR